MSGRRGRVCLCPGPLPSRAGGNGRIQPFPRMRISFLPLSGDPEVNTQLWGTLLPRSFTPSLFPSLSALQVFWGLEEAGQSGEPHGVGGQAAATLAVVLRLQIMLGGLGGAPPDPAT